MVVLKLEFPLPRPQKDPMYEHHVRGLELKLMYAGPRALTTSEKRELFLSADLIRRLRPEPPAKESRSNRGTARVADCMFGVVDHCSFLDNHCVLRTWGYAATTF